MNIGLILLLGSFLVGADNENSEKPTEESKSNNEKTTLNEMVVSKNNQDDPSEIKPDNKEPIQNKNLSSSLVNRPPTLSGEPKKTIKQDEHYSFMVQASDPDNDKLNFIISNKPSWAIFDTRTGALFGQPNNFDIGISKNIVISVLDQLGRKSSLMPFNIEVINVNDKPTISGIPSTVFIPGKTYKFTPKAKDMDVDIGKDKLKFSIKNKPKWSQFNQYTGELIGTPKGIISDSEEIIITVTDSLGESDSLAPFYIRALSPDNPLKDAASSPAVKKNIASLAIQNNSGYLNISSSLNQKDNVDTSAYKTLEESPNNFDEDTDTGSNDKQDDLDVAPTLDSKVDTDNNGDPTDVSARQTETEPTDIDSLDSDKDKEHDEAVLGNDSANLANDDGDLTKDNKLSQDSANSPVNGEADKNGNDPAPAELDTIKDSPNPSLDIQQDDNKGNESKDNKEIENKADVDLDKGTNQNKAVPVNETQELKNPVKDNEQTFGDEGDPSDVSPPKTDTEKTGIASLDLDNGTNQNKVVPDNAGQVNDKEQTASNDKREEKGNNKTTATATPENGVDDINTHSKDNSLSDKQSDSDKTSTLDSKVEADNDKDGDLTKDNKLSQDSANSPVNGEADKNGNDPASAELDTIKDSPNPSLDIQQDDNKGNESKDNKEIENKADIDADNDKDGDLTKDNKLSQDLANSPVNGEGDKNGNDPASA